MDYRGVNSMDEASEFCRRFSLSDIQSATENFSDTMLIGRGGFGKVYQGFIDDGATLVAIKRLNPESKQGAKESWTEVMTLYKFRHPHLITLIGYSDENEEMILVYEFMSNGTLADHLYKNHRNEKSRDIYHMTWKERLYICLGAARGLDHLHEGTQQSVIHRDVKTTNILLDRNWEPKISDFGLSKVSSCQIQTHVSTDVKGTFGYMDPQYFLTRKLTNKSDVYAFGVVLFEVLCGRPPVDFRVEDEQCSLAQWVQQCIKKGIIAQIVDPSLIGQISTNSLNLFSEVADRCLHSHPKGRPTMAEVVRSLELVLESEQPMPPAKGIINKVPSSFARCFLEFTKIGQKRMKFLNFKNKKPRQRNNDPSTEKAMEAMRRFTLKEIRAATNNFDQALVVGGSAEYMITIYRGLIDNGNVPIAVKRWKDGITNENLEIFNNDIRVQSQLRYIHLVARVGYCMEKNELICVYEYMGNGSLQNHLHESDDPLPWEKRLETCVGVARGVHYLHAGGKMPFIHRNLNPNNILLDQNWVAKLAGVEWPTVLLQDLQSTSFNPSVAAAVPVGYMDPEFIISGKCTVKSDVYSFGAILLELLCGRQPMIYSQDVNQVYLVEWFNTNLKMGTLDEVIDPRIIDEIAPECLKEYVKIAEKCTRKVESERPTMESVLDALRYALYLQETWQDFKQSGEMFSKPTISPPPEDSFPKGILIANKDVQSGNSQVCFEHLGDSDNLAR